MTGLILSEAIDHIMNELVYRTRKAAGNLISESQNFTFCFKHICGKITQVLNENARKPLSIGYLAFSLCSDILAVLSVF